MSLGGVMKHWLYYASFGLFKILNVEITYPLFPEINFQYLAGKYNTTENSIF